MAIPAVGEIAPLFEAQTDTGETLRLEDFRGKKVVLYFYPKADTPGCTKQACIFRDNYHKFEELGVVVLGASYDTVEEQANFKKKFSLPFTLLADPEHTLTDLYGLWGTHTITRKGIEYSFTGVNRSTFIIDENGVVMTSEFGVDPANNTAEVLEILQAQNT